MRGDGLVGFYEREKVKRGKQLFQWKAETKLEDNHVK
jgi:hypothetical protein